VLTLTHNAIASEARAAQQKVRAMNRVVDKMIRKRRGAHYMGSDSSEIGDHAAASENYYHRWLTYVIPQMVWGVPRVMVDADASQDAQELKVTLNRWANNIRLNEFLAEGPATDMQYTYGVVYMAPEPIPGAMPIQAAEGDETPGAPPLESQPRQPWQPYPYRIPQSRYFEDAMAMGRGEIRLQGHTFVRDKDDVKREGEEAGWNMEVIGEYASDRQLEALGRDSDGYQGEHPQIKRRELAFQEVWVPEADPTKEQLAEWGVEESPGPEEGFHGWIFTTTVRDDAEGETELVNEIVGYDDSGEKSDVFEKGDWPRKPRPFYGPPWGPYIVFGGGSYTATNQTLPVGPLMACEGEIRSANVDADVVTRMSRNYKRLIMVGGSASEQDIQIVRDGDHDNVYRVKGLDRDSMFAAEIGGTTPQVQEHLATKKLTVEENLGLSELHTGMAPRPGSTTATADAIADSAASVRYAGVEQNFHIGVESMFRTAGWYFWEDSRMGMRLGQKDAEELGVEPEVYANEAGELVEQIPELSYVGGQTRGIPFESMNFRIEPHSMKRTSEQVQQFRALQTAQLVFQGLPLMAQFPSFPWQEFWEQQGEQMNIPSLGKLFSDPEAVAQDLMAMAGPGPEQGGGQQAAPMQRQEPRTGLPGNQTGAAVGAMVR
jgi:hypothetical protein